MSFELGKLWTVLDPADPTAAREAFVTRRVLDDLRRARRCLSVTTTFPFRCPPSSVLAGHSGLLELRLTGLGYVEGALLTYKPASVPAAAP